MSSKEIEVQQMQDNVASEVAIIERVETGTHLETIPTIEVSNYHGLTVKCVLVYIVRPHIQLLSLTRMLTVSRPLNS